MILRFSLVSLVHTNTFFSLPTLSLVKKVVRRKNKTTPEGFEPSRAKPNGLAGRRLNHSAKVSSYELSVNTKLSFILTLGKYKMENPGFDPGASSLLTTHSTD